MVFKADTEAYINAARKTDVYLFAITACCQPHGFYARVFCSGFEILPVKTKEVKSKAVEKALKETLLICFLSLFIKKTI